MTHGSERHQMPPYLHLGIDCGLTGALAVLDADGQLIAVHDTPVITTVGHRGRRRQEYDLPGLAALLTPYQNGCVQVLIEEQHAMPGQGVRSMFTLGVGFGVWLALLAALQLPYTRIRPAQWKTALGLRGKDKEAARLRAQQLFPQADLRRKQDHGRAEALLLAEYGRRHLLQGPPQRTPQGTDRPDRPCIVAREISDATSLYDL